MPYDYVEEYQKQNDETIWLLRDKDAQEKISEIEEDIATDDITVTGNPLSFTTESAQLASDCDITLNPIQDLHGYSKPWVGGAGKNKLNSTLNTSSQGSLDYISQGNGIYKINGTASTNSGADFATNVSLKAGTYKILGLPSGVGSANTYIGLMLNGSYAYTTNDESFTLSADTTFDSLRFRPGNGIQLNNIIVKPMITNDLTVTYDTYEPYSNICPISGRASVDLVGCGKNLVDNIISQTDLPVTIIKSGNSYTFNPASEVGGGAFIDYKVLKGKTYSLSFIVSSGSIVNVRIYKNNTTAPLADHIQHLDTSGGTFTALEDGYVRFWVSSSVTIDNLQLEENNQATTYEPYTESNNITFTFGETVYGGSIDVRSGVVTVDRKIVDMSTLSWIDNTTQGYQRFRTNNVISDALTPQEDTNLILCSCMNTNHNPISQTSGNGISLYVNGYIYVRYEQVDNVTDFESAITGQTICYTLATPITIQLTPHEVELLTGANTITTDGDSISITYKDGKFATREDLLNTQNDIGNIKHLTTTAKSNLVSAINEIENRTDTAEGDISSLGIRVDAIKSETDDTTTSISGNPISISGLKSNQLAVNPTITLEPIQDLHGYSKPWVGGAGKNLLPMTVDVIKAANTSGTWSGNVYSINSIDFTILTDDANNVIGINVNGTASANIYFYFALDLDLQDGRYTISGWQNVVMVLRQFDSNNTVFNTYDTLTERTFTLERVSGDYLRAYMYISPNTSLVNQKVYPMIRLSTETSDFAPYENICPISGYDKIEVLSCGKNIGNKDEFVQGSVSGTTGEDTVSYIRLRSPFVRISNSKTYTIQCNSQVLIMEIDEYDANQRWLDFFYINSTSYTYTPNTQASFIKVLIRKSDNSVIAVSELTAFQIEEGNQATTYVPYNKTTDLSLTIGQTVYGGSLDVRTGVLTVTHKTVDLSTLAWTSNSAIIQDVRYYYWTSDDLSSEIKKPSSNSENPTWLTCEQFETIRSTATVSLSGHIGLQVSGRIVASYIATDSTTEPQGLMAYELATPTTIQLTPHEISLLKDYAYVSTNGTNIALNYHNGELASLGDLAQLGETVNALGDSLKNVDVKVYYSGTNENWKIYRIGRLRILTAWNCPVGKMLTYLDDVDKPVDVYDSMVALIDNRMSRFRIQADGGILCYYIYTYGGTPSSYNTSSTEKVFTSFAYVAKE